MKGMTDSERMMYRRGMLDKTTQRVKDAAGGATGAANPAKMVYGSVSDREKIAAALGDPGKFSTFDNAMQHMTDQRVNSAFIKGGSNTVEKNQGANMFATPAPISDAITAVMQGQTPTQVLARGARSVLGGGGELVTRQVRPFKPLIESRRFSRSLAPHSRVWSNKLRRLQPLTLFKHS